MTPTPTPTPTPIETDVLIAGAGPVGLALATELLRYGVRCVICDREPSPKAISKALILHVRTQEVLGAMDNAIAGPLTEAVPLRRVEVRAYGDRIGSWDLDDIDSPFRHPVIIGQDRTEHFLQRHLEAKGGRVEWRSELVSYEQDQDSVTGRLRAADGAETIVRSRYLVGCDGARSVVRKTLEAKGAITFDGGRYENEQFIQADCKIRWNLPRGSSYLFLTEQGYLMVIEMPGDTVRVFISLADPDPSDDSEPTLAEIQSALNRLAKVDATLSDPTWLARYRTSHRKASRYRTGRVFVAGDAAHIHVPIGGQGMNTGIQDAFNLGWKLAYVLRGHAAETLLDGYDEERAPIAAQLLRGTDRAYRNILHPGPRAQAAVRILGPFVMRRRAVQEKARSTLEQLGINYRASRWVRDLGGSLGPRAGDRFGDATFVRARTQETLRLFEAIRGEKFSVLLFAGKNAGDETYGEWAKLAARLREKWEGLVRVSVVVADMAIPRALASVPEIWLDSRLSVHERFGIRRACIYALRPDWVVGFRGKATHSPQLEEYLSRFAG